MRTRVSLKNHKLGKICLKKTISLVFFSFLLLGSAFSQIKNEPEHIQSEIKKRSLKPGQIILIGIISPEVERLILSEKEIPIEIEVIGELSEEEQAELKKRLEELKKERDILTGDFYGINQFGHRYAMVFDRLGYIRYRITKINEEIAEIKKKIKN